MTVMQVGYAFKVVKQVVIEYRACHQDAVTGCWVDFGLEPSPISPRHPAPIHLPIQDPIGILDGTTPDGTVPELIDDEFPVGKGILEVHVDLRYGNKRTVRKRL